MRAPATAIASLVLAASAAGCAQPGSQASKAQAARLSVATGSIATACGYAEELTAFGGRHPKGLGPVEAMAVSGARKLASVYRHDQTDLYQGESIAALVQDTISLLGDCGLPRARSVLLRALHG
jgi:hypothetical protein